MAEEKQGNRSRVLHLLKYLYEFSDEYFVGEDMDIVHRIQRYCRTKHRKYRIAYEPRTVCMTNVPSSLHRLFRQRDRWQRGLIGSLLRNTTFRPDKGILMRWIALPYMLIFDVMSPFCG